MPSTFDPYTPQEMATRVEAGGVAKAHLSMDRSFALGVLAGAFIGIGATFSTVVGTDSGLGFGPTRLLMGFAFSLGLILVLVGGAELFTGNNLLVIAWADRRVSLGALLRNWIVVYVANFVGALGTAWGVYASGIPTLAGGKVGQTMLAVASAKVALTWGSAFMRGVFCNALVCLAVWLTFSARTTTDKIACIVLPVTAFVAMGFEHSIANMYFVPLGMLLQESPHMTWTSFLVSNLLPVTLGNIVGGSALVGLVYWFIYLRRGSAPSADRA